MKRWYVVGLVVLEFLVFFMLIGVMLFLLLRGAP